MAAPGSSSRTWKLYLLLGLVALAGLALIGYAAVRAGGSAGATRPESLPIAVLDTLAAASLGSPEAGVVIAEFADFQCPGCAGFAANDLPRVKEELVAAGHARYLFVDLPLTSIHPNALEAARAARCAGEQGRFWEYHDLLFAGQPQWAAVEDPGAVFRQFAGTVGLSLDEFDGCLDSGRHTTEITRGAERARAAGVRGTPTLFIDGEPLSGIPAYEELRRLVLERGDSLR